MKKSPKRKSGTVQDARGESRPVISVNDLFHDPRMGDPAFAAVIERGLRLKLAGMRVGLGFGIAVAASLTLMLLPVLLRGRLGFTIPPYVGGAFPGIVAVVFTQWNLRRTEKRRAPELARILLADALCPCCSYGLADLPSEHDGCVVCPECGGAWQADRIVRKPHYKENPQDMPRARGFAVLWRDGIGTGALRLKDDAGTEYPLASPRLRREIAAARGDRKSRLVAAAKRNRRCGRVVRWGIAALYVGIACAMVYFGYSLAARIASMNVVPPASIKLVAFFVGAVLLAFAACFLRGSAGVNAGHVRREMLLKGLCPSCAADLPVESRTTEGPVPPAPALVTAEHPTPASSSQESASCPECQARWTSPALAMWRASTPEKLANNEPGA
jgi:hypothetical protein